MVLPSFIYKYELGHILCRVFCFLGKIFNVFLVRLRTIFILQLFIFLIFNRVVDFYCVKEKISEFFLSTNLIFLFCSYT